MKISRTKFVILFLVSGFVFQFISNSIWSSEVQLFPGNGEYLLRPESPIVWKNILSTILVPIKVVLIEPLSPLFELPDPPPPLLVLAFALYWTVIALVLHYLISKIRTRKKITLR